MKPYGIANVRVGGRAAALAVHQEDRVALLHEVVDGGPRTFETLLPEWDTWLDRIGAHVGSSGIEWLPAAEVEFLPAGVARPAIYCSGANYTDHVAEMGAEPAEPFHFASPVRVLNAHRGEVHRPQGVEKLDWEVELAVVIGRPSRNVAPADAWDSVAGYTVANDVSARDPRMFHSIFGVDWMFAKHGEGMTPVGPSVVPARFVPNPERLRLGVTVNGQTKQDSNTEKLIVGIADQIALLSRTLTLEPGDLILTGTPAGTAIAHGRYLEDGDEMVAWIESVGELANVVAPTVG